MSLFPARMESERLRYGRLHPDDFDPFELYEHVRAGATGIEDITRYVSWEPYSHPKQAFDWVAARGRQFDDGEAATYAVRPKDGDRAGELAGLTGFDVHWDRRLATMGTWFR